MNRLFLKYYFLITILFAGALAEITAVAQSGTPKESYLDKAEWERLSKKTDYTENFKEPKKRDKKPEKQTNIAEKTHKPGSGLGLKILKVLLYIVVIGALAFVLFLVMKRFFNFFEEKVPSQIIAKSVEDLEQNLHKSDIDKILEQALALREYKLAVRILYLKTIKILSESNLIEWKKDKTNARYVAEMMKQTTGKHFAFLTRVYEQAWFSSYEIDVFKYQLISDEFTHFYKKLN